MTEGILNTQGEHQNPMVKQQPAMPKIEEKIQSSTIEFTGGGSEYFRIWIVNLLLILVTVGWYLPWAKVRKLKYFYNNTLIDGHPLDFHGDPKKMLRGSIIAGMFFGLYSYAVKLSPVSGVVALSALAILAPILFRASMRFRLANTSWRGMRFRFVAPDVKEAVWCLLPPIVMVLGPGVLLAFMTTTPGKSQNSQVAAALIGYILLVLAVMPYFFWRLKRYQHNHYAWGPMTSEYRSPLSSTYKIFGHTLLIVVLIMVVFAVVFGVFAFASSLLFASGDAGKGASVGLFAVFLVIAVGVIMNVFPRALLQAKMQNLLWSRTGNNYFRLKSELPVRKFVMLQMKNWLLIAITLGLYWPFAVMATKRMQLEAVTLKTRVPLDQLSFAALARENDAAGDMAADIFGFDVGM